MLLRICGITTNTVGHEGEHHTGRHGACLMFVTLGRWPVQSSTRAQRSVHERASCSPDAEFQQRPLAPHGSAGKRPQAGAEMVANIWEAVLCAKKTVQRAPLCGWR